MQPLHPITHKQHYHFEGIADPVIHPDDLAGDEGQALSEEEVCRKDTDERKVLLAAQAHDCERSLDTPSQILVLRTLHPTNLMCMLCQGTHQLVLFAAALGHVAPHSCGHLR